MKLDQDHGIRASPAESSGSRGIGDEDPSKLLERLHLHDKEIDDLMYEDGVDATEEKPKWLAPAILLEGNNFSQSALIAAMRGLGTQLRMSCGEGSFQTFIGSVSLLGRLEQSYAPGTVGL